MGNGLSLSDVDVLRAFQKLTDQEKRCALATAEALISTRQAAEALTGGQQMKNSTVNQRGSSVYAIQCNGNGKIYIGCSFDVKARIRSHFTELRSGRKQKTSPVWQNDFQTYGEDAFSFYLLETGIPYELRRIREAAWISEYRSTEHDHGYNIDSMPLEKKVTLQEKLPPKAWEVRRCENNQEG